MSLEGAGQPEGGGEEGEERIGEGEGQETRKEGCVV